MSPNRLVFVFTSFWLSVFNFALIFVWLKRLQNVSIRSFTGSETSTPGNEYRKLSNNIQDLKENMSSLKESSVSRGLTDS